jgi:hypothetical protein
MGIDAIFKFSLLIPLLKLYVNPLPKSIPNHQKIHFSHAILEFGSQNLLRIDINLANED